MTKVDKLLRFICRCLGVIFAILAVFLLVGCIFGLILARHVDNTTEVLEQVRATGFAAFVCFLASFTFHYTESLSNKEVANGTEATESL